MDLNQINGQRQYDFVAKFPYAREAGTEWERKAADAIVQDLEELGLCPRIEEFQIEKDVVELQTFYVTEPYVKEYTVAGYLGCGSTPEEGIEAPFLYVENGDDISLSLAKDHIVMINGYVSKNVYEKLILAGVKGFLTVVGTPIEEGEDCIPKTYTLRGLSDPKLQGMTIHYKDGIELVEQKASRVKMVLQQERRKFISQNVVASIEASTKANTQAYTQGQPNPNEIITLTAHYDSVPQGPGAYDNMAGAAIILELGRYFAMHPCGRRVELIFLGAEELGLYGSRAYVRDHEEELHRHVFNFNVDLAGQLIGGTVLGVTADGKVIEELEKVLRNRQLGASFSHSVWSSDSNTFAWKGIPALTLNRDGFGMHTRHDGIQHISDWSLQRNAMILGEIVDYVGNVIDIPWNRKIPEEFAEKLEEYYEKLK